MVRTPAPKVDSVTSGVTSCNSPGRGIVESLQMELSSVVDFDQGFEGIIWDTAFIVDALTGMPAGGGSGEASDFRAVNLTNFAED